MKKLVTICAIVVFFTIILFSIPSHADTVLGWNNTALDALRADSTSPPVATRALAIVHCAMFDAINAVEGQYCSYNYGGTAAPGTNTSAAAISAAYNTLSVLFPTQAATFAAKYNSDIAALGTGQSIDDGIALGQAVAANMLNLRSTDGSGNTYTYLGSTDVGKWRPTPPGNAPGLLPLWGSVTPFAVQSSSQFMAPAPPALSSAEYTASYNEVKDYGAIDSTVRTADQTETAQFWSDGAGTYTPPGHWNDIAQTVATELGWSEYENARAFALLNISLADAAITGWEGKYEYELWRPITAIVEGDSDTNPDTVGDTEWLPLLTTPPFPESASGHSMFSGSAAQMLALLVGYDNFAFVTDSDGLLGVERSFDSFSEAAIEAGKSRIYGGIHFEFSNYSARDGGMAISDYVFENYLLPVPEPATMLLLGLGSLILLHRKK